MTVVPPKYDWSYLGPFTKTLIFGLLREVEPNNNKFVYYNMSQTDADFPGEGGEINHYDWTQVGVPLEDDYPLSKITRIIFDFEPTSSNYKTLSLEFGPEGEGCPHKRGFLKLCSPGIEAEIGFLTNPNQQVPEDDEEGFEEDLSAEHYVAFSYQTTNDATTPNDIVKIPLNGFVGFIGEYEDDREQIPLPPGQDYADTMYDWMSSVIPPGFSYAGDCFPGLGSGVFDCDGNPENKVPTVPPFFYIQFHSDGGNLKNG